RPMVVPGFAPEPGERGWGTRPEDDRFTPEPWRAAPGRRGVLLGGPSGFAQGIGPTIAMVPILDRIDTARNRSPNDRFRLAARRNGRCVRRVLQLGQIRFSRVALPTGATVINRSPVTSYGSAIRQIGKSDSYRHQES